MRLRFHALAWRNLVLTKELVLITRLLETNGFPTVAYKGPVLATSAYGEISRRQFSDLDILIDKRHILNAKDLLLSEGYRLEHNLSHSEAADWLRSDREHHFLMVRAESQFPIELHWSILQRCFAFPIESDQLFQRRAPVLLEGTTVFGPGPEDMLLILCAHSAKHGWVQLRMIADVDALIRSAPGLDWALIIDQSRALHAGRILALGLVLAHDLLQTPMPEKALRLARSDPAATSLAKKALGQLTHHLPQPLGTEPVSGLYLKARERLSDRIRVCLRLGRIPRDVDRATLPLRARWLIRLAFMLTPRHWDRHSLVLSKPLSFLAQVRPIRLLAKYVRSLFRRKLNVERNRRTEIV
jgi:hypothetical protein